ncbi:MAG: acetylxylan esterase [Spirochaetales bacterium]|nr:acetylxylan esterase [Spirochaetales bacterium]
MSIKKENRPDHRYPSREELEVWIQSVFDLADEMNPGVEVIEQTAGNSFPEINHCRREFRFIRFTPRVGEPFYAYLQPAASTPAPLLVHLPGYGAEMSTHPELVASGYNVLHISPLGYAAPREFRRELMKGDNWPVLPDTVSSGAREGYRHWFANAAASVAWAQSQPEVLPERLSFFGTSQGGGASLILGSLFRDRGLRCVAADLPFLTNYPLAAGRGAYCKASEGLEEWERIHGSWEGGWKALGYVDTLSHAYRLTVPVLLTAGGEDDVCPPETVESLNSLLPGIRSLSYFPELVHRYSREFIPLAAAWFGLYA